MKSWFEQKYLVFLLCGVILLIFSTITIRSSIFKDRSSNTITNQQTESTAGEQKPEDNGKVLVESRCTKCHTTERIYMKKRSKDEWTLIIRQMRRNGAELNNDEATTVINYLSNLK